MPATEYTLASGPYSATITTRGGALRQLRHNGRDLVVGFDANGPVPDYRGVVCAPWPNRLADGAYTYAGRVYAAPVNEPERGTALHGFVTGLDWTVEDATDSTVTLGCRVEAGAAYPTQLAIDVTYSLSADGLHCTVRAANTGSSAAPYGVCPHPYLVAGPAPLDDWWLEVPAEEFLDVTPDRLLPVAVAGVENHPFDFRRPRRIGAVRIDHAFTGISRGADGLARVQVKDPAGTGVELTWGVEWPWVQIHTADKPAGPDRLGLAVEPMTCPPDAYNSGLDLIHLEPGVSHAAAWTIRALG